MGLWNLLILLFFIGTCLYLFNTYWTVIDARVKAIMNTVAIGVCILLVILYLMRLLNVPNPPIG